MQAQAEAEDVADTMKICLSQRRLDSCEVPRRRTALPLTFSEQHCHLDTQEGKDTGGRVMELRGRTRRSDYTRV